MITPLIFALYKYVSLCGSFMLSCAVEDEPAENIEMVLQKIMFIVLLIVCLTHTSSSCATCTPKHCSCNQNSSPDTSEIYNVIHNKHRQDVFAARPQFHPKESIQNKEPEYENGILNYYTPHIENGEFNLNPIDNIHVSTRYKQTEPLLTEKILKQIWKSYQKQNAKSPLHTKDLLSLSHVLKPNNKLEGQEQSNGQPGFIFEQYSQFNPNSHSDTTENLGGYDHEYISDNSNLAEIETAKPSHGQFQYNVPQYFDTSNIGKPKTNWRPQIDVSSKFQLNKPTYPHEKIKYYVFDIDGLNNKRKSNIYKPNKPNMYNTKPIENQYNSQATYIAPTKMSSKAQDSGNFDKWVLEQIKILKDKNQGSHEIDSERLGYSILRILSENGMYITKDGMLIDTFGTVSRLDSLSLTPIIIGNTMSLKSLFEGKYGIMLSKLRKPYLEAILISAADPVKILGVMPLGAAYLPLSMLSSLKNIGADILDGHLFEVLSNKGEFKAAEVNESKKDNHDVGDEKDIYHNMVSNSGRVISENNDSSDGNNIKVLHERQLDSNGARLFLPRIEIREQPIDILTRRQYQPYIAASYPEATKIQIPSLSGFLNIFHNNEKPLETVYNKQHTVSEIANAPLISAFIDGFSDSSKNVVIRNGLPLKKIIPGENLQIFRDVKPVVKLIDSNFNVLKKVDLTLPYAKMSSGSRSGDDPDTPETPPENINSGNGGNGGNFDLVENDEDDDGDFRIIGGNAATGSGTPLSNRGRSGHLF